MLNRVIISTVVAAAAAAAAAAVVLKKVSEEKKEEKPEEVEKDTDDTVNFIRIDDDDDEEDESLEKTSESPEIKEEAEEPAEEEKPAEIPIDDGEPKEKEPEEEKEYPEQVDAIAQLYPYLARDFILEQFNRNDAFNSQYPEDTLVTITHKAKFPDEKTLDAYTKIAEENGYTSKKISDTESLISRRFFTEDTAILSDIYNVANQAACLKGTYEGYDIGI